MMDEAKKKEALTPEERQTLLMEYQVCQEEKHHQATAYWTIVGIFLSFITTIAAFIIKNILEKTIVLDSDSNERWVVLGLSLLSLCIIFFLFIWLERTRYFIQIANKRMRDLEDKDCGFLVNTLAHNLEKNEKDWPKKYKEILKEYKKDIKICCLAKVFKGRCIAIALFILVSIPWIFLAIISVSKCVKEFILG